MHSGKIIIQLFFYGAILTFSPCCSDNNTEKKKPVESKTDIFLPPVSVLMKEPVIALPGTYLPPVTIIVPTKPTNKTITLQSGLGIAKVGPPKTKPADFFSHMQNFNTDNGLALDGVVSAYTDKRGNLWFGTGGGGVSRYNGKCFTNFTTTQGLANNYVWNIMEDKSGNIWFGTNGGASRYDGKSFTNFTTTQGLANNAVLRIREDKMGNIWFGTNGGGVSRYDGKSFTNFATGQGLAGNIIWSILEDKTGNMWFGTDCGGVSRYDGNRVEAIERGDTIAGRIQGDLKKINGKLVKSFTNYTAKQGLTDNAIIAITEDKWGNLWFGSSKGVSRYDGNRVNVTEREDSIARRTQQDLKKINEKLVKLFINYTPEQGLVNNIVTGITEDKSGTIWFSTHGGVSRYDEKPLSTRPCGSDCNKVRFTNFTVKQGLTNNGIYSTTKDGTGNFWFATQAGGVIRYDGGSFLNYTIAQGLADNMVWSIVEDKTGNLWFGTNGGGVTRYDGNRVEAIESGDTIAREIQYDLKKTNGKLIKTFTTYTPVQGLIGMSVLNAAEDRLGNLWFGTYFGLSRYDGNRVEAIERGDTIAIRNRQDLKKVNGKLVKTFTNYTTAQGLVHNSIFSILEDKTGCLWFGTKNGVSCYKGNLATACETRNSIGPCTSQELKKIKKKTAASFINYTTAQGLVGNMVTCIREDETGNLWFGTNAGVSRYDGNRVEAIENGDTLALQTTHDLKKINGKLVKTFTNYTTAQGLPDNRVISIREDKTGIFWFGTDGGGVSRYDGKSFLNYSTAQGLPDNVLTQVAVTKEENLLFGTNQGITILTCFSPKVSPTSLSNEKERETHNIPAQNTLSNEELKNYIPVFEIYNTSTGFPVRDVTMGRNAVYIDKKGIIWIGTGSDKTGLVRFDYSALNRNKNPLDVIIQSVKINNQTILWNDLSSTPKIENLKPDSTATPANITEEVTVLGKVLNDAERDTLRQKFRDIKFNGIARFYPLPENLVLPYQYNHITFDFTAIEPAKPYLVRYQYMLEGYDKDWSPLTDKTSAVFGNIHEGRYTFKLKARSPFGVWSPPIQYKFTVLPPWWRSGWMYTVYGIILFLIILSLYFYVIHRIRTIRKREEEKTRLNKQISEIEMKALRSQMNPHFIFNVMNSVQDYILENDRATAQDYLAKFARLMRYVLENSKAENITLENEIETLKLYVTLEQLRIPGKFTYRVNVEPSISIMNTLIMPMLLQPFIENAIIHGIMHKNGNEGKIELTIKKLNDQLVCEVEDNGIGRNWSKKIKSARSHSHNSMGMNVTEERISILNNLHGKKATVTIEDQTDENGNPSGTKVTLTIPYIIQNN